MNIQTNSLTFNANAGKNLLRYVKKNEFAGDSTRVQKFAALFQRTFENITDKGTTVDVNKNLDLVFYHKLAPYIKYCYKTSFKNRKSVSESLINECTKTIARGEYLMFRNIASQKARCGMDFTILRAGAEGITNAKIKESYLENIEILERIKKENPSTQFTNDEFNYEKVKKMEEDAQKPGTEMYEMINNLDKLSVRFD